MHWCECRRPIVLLKAALDCNGNVDSKSGPPARFTSAESLDEVHRLRKDCDAVLVGVNTVVRDNPELTVRRVALGNGKQPLGIVLDRTLRTPESSTLVSDEHDTLILHCEGDKKGLECDTILMPPLFSDTQACVFLKTDSPDLHAPGTCEVWENRPEGCRIYPLVLDQSDQPFLDELCPHRDQFPAPPIGLRGRLLVLSNTLDDESIQRT